MTAEKLKIWIAAARPKTLPAAFVPVFFGSIIALLDGVVNLPLTLATLLAALCIQIGTNFINDYCDFQKGADNDRLGPMRVMQAGLVSKESMRRAIGIIYFCAVLFALYPIKAGGLPIIIIGVISMLLAYGYTGGPLPLAYHGLGDVFVFIFFGPVAAGGTYYILTGQLSSASLMAGCLTGAISTAILVVNNIRDIEGDKAAGKRTLAVRFGTAFSQIEYILMHLVAIFLFQFLLIKYALYSIISIGLLILLAIWQGALIRRIFISKGTAYNALLADTGKLLLGYGFVMLLAVAL